MEITVNTLDDQKIKLKSSAAVLVKYKAQFGREMLSDIFEIADSVDKITVTPEGEILTLPENLNWEIFLNMIWALAKNADDNICTPDEFFDKYEIDLPESYTNIIGLIIRSIGVKSTLKKKPSHNRKRKKKK